MIQGIRQDVVFAARSLLRHRGVTAVAVLSLAIGIAANGTIFSLVQALEFPRLIYPDAGRIVFLESRNHTRGLTGMLVSAPDAGDVADASRTLEHASLTADQTSVLREGVSGRRVSGRRVTPAFFELFGIPARLGRVLAPGDGPDRILLSDTAWRTYFAADPSVTGRGFHLDEGMVTIAGVMPPDFDEDAEFWVALTESPASRGRDDRQFTLFARLAPGASVRDASTELSEISGRLARDHPGTNANWEMFPVPLRRMHGRDSRQAFLLLQAAVGFVLLIACANIANILLARGPVRRHEMAVRVSLGAGRGRLLRGLLVESLLLSLAGGALGLMWSMWGIRLARHMVGFPSAIEPHLNVSVVGFTAILSMLCGIICGILPALRASRIAPEAVLRADGRGLTGGGRGWLRAALVATQIACALVLALCGALMVQTLVNRQRVNLGYDPRGAVRADIVLDASRYRDPVRITAAVDALFEHVGQASGVTAAGASTWALPTGAGGQRQLTLPGEENRALATSIRRGVEAVTPGYFAALGVPMKLGRPFTGGDRQGAAPVAIVNQELARQLWPDGDPIGETLRLGAASESAPIVTVVGVVGTIRRSAMHDVPPAHVYLPFAQHPNATLSVVVRSETGAAAAVRGLEAAVNATDPALMVEEVRTVEADVARFVAPVRTMTSLLGALGVAGLLLAALGVFGSMSYAVSQRQQEMAVRSALGATRGQIFRVVFGAASRILVAGLAMGTAAGAVATRALESFLFGVAATDSLTLAAVALLMTVIALAACYVPARAAATADPLPLLRQ
ncbi:MAG: ABC transporter permease [Acidobacteria bacterium]|nr:ABC transporter permease [Acidobacteriota bacterium]